MFDLQTYLSDVRKRLNALLQRALGGLSPDPQVSRAMSYSVMAGGKRLRPVLCIAAGPSKRRALKAALKGGLISQLVIDEDSAAQRLARLEEEWKRERREAERTIRELLDQLTARDMESFESGLGPAASARAVAAIPSSDRTAA